MRKAIPLALAVVAVLVLATTALAFPVVDVTHAPRIPIKESTSRNWSGYGVETNLSNPQSNVVTNVAGSWVVPNVTCTSQSTYSSAWVGIDGYSDRTVEQIGTDQDCSGGSPRYYAWYEMYPKMPVNGILAINAGDSISAGVQYTGGGKYVLTLVNNTSGKSFSTTQYMPNAQRSSAEWIMEAPWSGSILTLANFGTINFSGASATINGHTGSISDSQWQNDPITMVNGLATATPSKLKNGGSAFSVKWASK
ncbi:MAG TPA: G1 family glutamic endopeptidase [Chloroflexota bacterium]